MGAVAAGASAIAVPLAQAYGWRTTLAAFVVLPLIALAVWRTQLGAHTAPAKGTPPPPCPHGGRIWHSAIAWQVTLYMGINSLLYYVLVGWLPVILTEQGFSAAEAGSMHGLMQPVLRPAWPGAGGRGQPHEKPGGDLGRDGAGDRRGPAGIHVRARLGDALGRPFRGRAPAVRSSCR